MKTFRPAYLSLLESGELAVINAVSREIFKKIEVGEKPFMAVIPE